MTSIRKAKQERLERYAKIKNTFNELRKAGTEKYTAIYETKRIHAPISIATIYRALKEGK